MNSIPRSKGGLGWVNPYSKVRIPNEIREISACQEKNTTRKNWSISTMWLKYFSNWMWKHLFELATGKSLMTSVRSVS